MLSRSTSATLLCVSFSCELLWSLYQCDGPSGSTLVVIATSWVYSVWVTRAEDVLIWWRTHCETYSCNHYPSFGRKPTRATKPCQQPMNDLQIQPERKPKSIASVRRKPEEERKAQVHEASVLIFVPCSTLPKTSRWSSCPHGSESYLFVCFVVASNHL
jgi:hypothetical protein